MNTRYFVSLHKDARKFLLKSPNSFSIKAQEIISALEENPYLGSKMNGKYDVYRKIRIGNYRIIYQVKEDRNQIFIREIESRGNVSYD